MTNGCKGNSNCKYSHVILTDRKEPTMLLKIRYDQEFQFINLSSEEKKQLMLSLSLDDCKELSEEECDKYIQTEFDNQFNKPEYNSWHKFYRHRGYSKSQLDDYNNSHDSIDINVPFMEEVMDDRVFYKDEIEITERMECGYICNWILKVLSKKPKWADAFISVRMHNIPIKEYASNIGISDTSIISKWIKRASSKLQKNYKNRHI